MYTGDRDVRDDLSSPCPFCDYRPPEGTKLEHLEYDIAHHVELAHREDGTGRSPFEVIPHHSTSDAGPPALSARSKRASRSSSSSSTKPTTESDGDGPDDEYVECPRQCGETIPKQMLDQHIGLHQAEEIALDELEGQYAAVGGKPNRDHLVAEPAPTRIPDHGLKEPRSQKRGILRDFFGMSSAIDKVQRKSGVPTTGQRLGRKELGPHAYEEKMPSWLYRQLKEGPTVSWINQIGPDGRVQRAERVANETPGLIPAIADLCRQDRSVSKAWLCSPGVKHIFKMRREGGFCGYRNIQMQTSWMQHNKHPGYGHFGKNTPNILDLQIMIEDAWQKGFNSSGKAETGGIIGTRKYIGTPEAQALFRFLGIDCQAAAFTKKSVLDNKAPVYAALLESVLDYFSRGVVEATDKVYMTELPPIYFQHPGHSLTIVGIEVHKNRDINLLVFDPMFPTVPAMLRYIHLGPSTTTNPGKILKAFRRGEEYVRKYKSFEILHLVPA